MRRSLNFVRRPNTPVHSVFGLQSARLSCTIGQYAEVVVELEKLVRLRPDDAKAQMLFGDALAKLGKLDDAEGLP